MPKQEKKRRRGMGSIFKHGRSWYIAYYVGGQQIKEKIGTVGLATKGQSEQALKARMGEVVQGRFKIENVKKSIALKGLIGRYIDWIKDNRKTNRTEVQVTKTFLEFSGNRRINKITTWDIEQYKSQRRKDGLKPSTINRELTVLRSMFNRAIEWDEIKENPLSGVKKALPLKAEDHDRKAECIPMDVFTKILENANESLRSFLIVSRNTGMRVSELTSLRCKDINLSEEVINIRDSKNYTQRVVPMNATVLNVFKEILTSDKTEEDRVFDYAGKNSVGTAWRRLRERMNLKKKYRLHDLRHSFVTDLVTAGFDIKTIMEITGHRDMRTLIQRYTHPTFEHKKKAVKVLDAKSSYLNESIG